jgi:catechol 2,3-dioxygenase-like lactoylglutathione lyase family enzyme
MLTAYPLNGFLRITDPERARRFYEHVLGLAFDYENPYVSVFRSGDTSIIAQRVKEVVPVASTVLGWEVKDIEKVAAFLRDRGVVFERYPHMEQEGSASCRVPPVRSHGSRIRTATSWPFPNTKLAGSRRSPPTGASLYCSHRTPKSASVEPTRILSQHLVVEFFCGYGLFREFLKIKNVLPRLSNHPRTVVVILWVFMTSDDSMWRQGLHLVQRRD